MILVTVSYLARLFIRTGLNFVTVQFIKHLMMIYSVALKADGTLWRMSLGSVLLLVKWRMTLVEDIVAFATYLCVLGGGRAHG